MDVRLSGYVGCSSPPLLLLYLSVKGYMLLLEHGATDQVRKLVRQGAALKGLCSTCTAQVASDWDQTSQSARSQGARVDRPSKQLPQGFATACANWSEQQLALHCSKCRR